MFTAPMPLHPLGTDDLGRDLLAGLAHGGRASLLTDAVVTLGAALLAVVLGVVAGMASPAVDLDLDSPRFLGHHGRLHQPARGA